MNSLMIIDEREVLGKEFRIYGTNENPLFLAKDVAEWIEYGFDSKGNRDTNGMLRTIDEEEKEKNVNPINNRVSWFLTEDGLYEVLMQSRKPIAKQFKKQVKQILKQIRQTGGYIPVSQEDDEQELLAKAFLIAQKTIEKKEELLQQATKVIEEQKPLVEMAKDFLDKDGLVSVDDFAKNLAIKGLGRNNMYKYLREQKILMTDEWENPFTLKKMYGENHHKPYARFINEGKMVWKPTSYNTHTEKYNHKPYFTAQGVEYMLKKLRKNGYIK